MKTGRLLLAALLASLFALVAVSAAPAEAAPYPPSTCPQLGVSTTTPFAGQQITVTGSGFAAGQSITLVLRSDVVVLAHVTADANGNFSVQVRIPADAEGAHVIAVQEDTSDCPVDPIQIRVQGHGTEGVTTPGGGLAFTGFDAFAAIAIALALIGAGVLLSRGGRRRRHHSAHSAGR
jgi:hypothetical protein